MVSSEHELSDGVLYIHFTVTEPLSSTSVNEWLGAIVGGLPIAPDEVRLDVKGEGLVAYGSNDALTVAELSEAVVWLQRRPSVRDVHWRFGLATGPEG